MAAPLEFYLACAAGASALFFKLKNDGTPVLEFLPHFSPKWAGSPLGRLFDAAMFVGLGAYIGVALVDPSNVTQAVWAGLGWTGLLSAAGSAGGSK